MTLVTLVSQESKQMGIRMGILIGVLAYEITNIQELGLIRFTYFS